MKSKNYSLLKDEIIKVKWDLKCNSIKNSPKGNIES